MKYVVLLRGINVGNSVKIPMRKLRTLLEEIGLRNVVTYLNSGNAIFESLLPADKLTNLIGKRLEKEFGQKKSISVDRRCSARCYLAQGKLAICATF